MISSARHFLLRSTFLISALLLMARSLGSTALHWRVFVSYVALFAVTQLYGFQHAISHSYFEFRALALQMGLFAVCLPPLVWLMTRSVGLAGFMIPQVILMLLSVYYLQRVSRRQIGWSLDRALLGRLMKTGIPIGVVGQMFFVLTSVDRWVIVAYLGRVELGYYALAVFCVNSLSILTRMVSMQFYPRMAYLFGKTGRTRPLARLVWSQFMVNAVLMSVIVLCFFLSIDYVVAHFMPKYQPGLRASKIIMSGVAFLACVNPFAAMLNSTGKHREYFLTQCGAVAFTVAAVVFAARQYRTIEAVAAATTAGYVMYMLSMVLIGCRILYRDGMAEAPVTSGAQSENTCVETLSEGRQPW